MSSKTTIILALLFLLLPAAGASAHSSGLSLVATSSGSVVDLGYDAPPVAGQYTLFDFVLRDAAKNTPQDYAYVWVRIVHADETLLAAGIHHQILGPTTFLYEFTAAGEYALAVSYRNKDDEEIASSTFPMSVAGHSGAQSGAYALYLFMAIGGGVVGAVAALIFKRRKNV
jgi:hypothetical protein